MNLVINCSESPPTKAAGGAHKECVTPQRALPDPSAGQLYKAQELLQYHPLFLRRGGIYSRPKHWSYLLQRVGIKPPLQMETAVKDICIY